MKKLEQWQDYISKRDLMKSTLRATRLYAVAPSIVEPGEFFVLQIVALGADGYPDQSYRDQVRFEANAPINGLPQTAQFGTEDQGILRLSGLSVAEEGTLLLRLQCERTLVSGACNPIWVQREPAYRIFWGDMHVHSELGQCGEHIYKSPDFGYWFGREVMALDYVAMADHARSLNDKKWVRTLETTKRHHDPGEFVTILGFETDYDGEDGGHFNIYYRGDEGDYRNFLLDAGGSLEKIYEFVRQRGAMAISHHNGRSIRGRDYAKSWPGGPDIEPVVEIYSKWGSSEELNSHRPVVRGAHPSETHYYRYALRSGYKLGVIGGSDDHNTCPGSYMDMWFPGDGGRRDFYRSSGLGAILCKELTRQSIWEALFARRCYGASGERFLLDFRIDDQVMGQEIVSRHPDIQVRAVASSPLRELCIIKDGREFHRVIAPGQECSVGITDEKFEGPSSYYARIIDEAGDAAWSSPIWVSRG